MPKVKWRDPGTREWQEREFIRREDARAHAARLARFGIPYKQRSVEHPHVFMRGRVYERVRPGDVDVEEMWAWGNPKKMNEAMAAAGGEFDWEEWGERSLSPEAQRARRNMRARRARAEAAKRVRTAKK